MMDHQMTPALLDSTLLPSSEGLAIDALLVPANRRSAEHPWYDVFAIGEERFVVAIGNVTGSAADAAALLLPVRERFAGGAATTEPGSLRRAAEALLAPRAHSPATFGTAIIGIVDCAAQTFTYVSAGHPPPFIRYPDGTVAALPADGLPLGLAEFDYPPAEVVVNLQGAELLMLYSNVIVQTTKDVADGLARLRHFLGDERLTSCSSPAAWIARRTLGDRSHDAAALLALKLASRRRSADAFAAPAGDRPRWSVSWSFDATGPASTGARRAFLSCLASKDNAGRAIDFAAAELIFGELLGNVVRHAPGLVEIRLDWTGELPVLHVLDNGPGFRSRRARERLPVDDLSENGRGLFIVNACAAKFSVRNRKGRGTHASAVLLPA
jgi:anti-sigma regulatory factor (Ser/Thr protein kinase)